MGSQEEYLENLLKGMTGRADSNNEEAKTGLVQENDENHGSEPVFDVKNIFIDETTMEDEESSVEQTILDDINTDDKDIILEDINSDSNELIFDESIFDTEEKDVNSITEDNNESLTIIKESEESSANEPQKDRLSAYMDFLKDDDDFEIPEPVIDENFDFDKFIASAQEAADEVTVDEDNPEFDLVHALEFSDNEALDILNQDSSLADVGNEYIEKDNSQEEIAALLNFDEEYIPESQRPEPKPEKKEKTKKKSKKEKISSAPKEKKERKPLTSIFGRRKNDEKEDASEKTYDYINNNEKADIHVNDSDELTKDKEYLIKNEYKEDNNISDDINLAFDSLSENEDTQTDSSETDSSPKKEGTSDSDFGFDFNQDDFEKITEEDYTPEAKQRLKDKTANIRKKYSGQNIERITDDNFDPNLFAIPDDDFGSDEDYAVPYADITEQEDLTTENDDIFNDIDSLLRAQGKSIDDYDPDFEYVSTKSESRDDTLENTSEEINDLDDIFASLNSLPEEFEEDNKKIEPVKIERPQEEAFLEMPGLDIFNLAESDGDGFEVVDARNNSTDDALTLAEIEKLENDNLANESINFDDLLSSDINTDEDLVSDNENVLAESDSNDVKADAVNIFNSILDDNVSESEIPNDVSDNDSSFGDDLSGLFGDLGFENSDEHAEPASGEDLSDILGVSFENDEENSGISDDVDMLAKKEKKGFWARLIDLLFKEDPEPEEPENLEMNNGNEDTIISDENKQILEDADKEDKGKKKKKKKKGEPENEDSDSSEDEEGEDTGKKKKKKKQPKVKKEKPEEPATPEKALSFKKMLPIFLICAALGATLILLAKMTTSYATKKAAVKAYYQEDYTTCYRNLFGKELNESETIMFNRSEVILRARLWVSEYEMFDKLGDRTGGLDSLIQSIEKYPALLAEAQTCNAVDDVNKCYNILINYLYNQYHLSAVDAVRINAIESDEDYTKVVARIAMLNADMSVLDHIHDDEITDEDIESADDEEMSSPSIEVESDLLAEEEEFLEGVFVDNR